MIISKQLNKEAIITCILYLIYFIWWYYFAYIYEGKEYVMGLPAWFFYSCVLGLVVINILVFLAVKIFFKEIKLDESEDDEK